jgi:hypothetical protein
LAGVVLGAVGVAPPAETVELWPDAPVADTPPLEEAKAAAENAIATKMPQNTASTALNRTSTSFVGLRG